MDILCQNHTSSVVKITLQKDGIILGRAFIYLIKNELHQQPYALLEDVFIEETFRGQGHGAEMVKAAINKAKELGCYKIIGTSRNSRIKIHRFYQKLGFTEYGKEFRLDIKENQ